MIEVRGRPSRRRVTRLAGLRKAQLHVIRIGRALIVLQVARNARRVRDVEIVVNVTIRALAWWNRVHASQREAGRRVVEIHVDPVVEYMALLAVCRESSAHMTRVARVLEVGRMAAIALRRQTFELTHRR